MESVSFAAQAFSRYKIATIHGFLYLKIDFKFNEMKFKSIGSHESTINQMI